MDIEELSSHLTVFGQIELSSAQGAVKNKCFPINIVPLAI